MSDSEDALAWVLVTACALFAAAILIGIGFLIAWQVKESSAKQDCRAAGRRVTEDARGEEWWCAPITLEKP